MSRVWSEPLGIKELCQGKGRGTQGGADLTQTRIEFKKFHSELESIRVEGPIETTKYSVLLNNRDIF